MAQKKSAPTDEELSAMFEGIGTDDTDAKAANAANKQPITTTAQPDATTSSGEGKSSKPTPTSSNDNDDDPLAELATLAAAPRPSSRSSTPRMSSTATSVRKNTPQSGSGRSSEEKAAATLDGDAEQKKAKAAQAQQQSPQQQPQSPEAAATAGAGGWWGGLSGFSSLASAAVKQARGAVEELQKNEEAQKWADQVKGNYVNLRGLGGDLRSRALPTFTNILHAIAPPISQHERLQIHITHDLVEYPSLDPMIFSVFSRVMSQVEGGDLLVIQRGSESGHRRNSEGGYTGSSGSGWSDGPWWRESSAKRTLGSVNGLVEGTKLVRVSAESYANEFFSSRGGLEEAAKQATAVLSESNPVRSSDVFLAIQPIVYTATPELFAAGKEEKSEAENVVVDEPAQPEELVSFAVYLYDPVHTISFSTVSQSFPHKWASWMDAPSTSSVHDGTQFVPQLPEQIVEIMATGGVDPREWVAEWMEETMSLAVGVVAQRYVARRMGVGEGGIGRGKRREEIVESGGGEAARAV